MSGATRQVPHPTTAGGNQPHGRRLVMRLRWRWAAIVAAARTPRGLGQGGDRPPTRDRENTALQRRRLKPLNIITPNGVDTFSSAWILGSKRRGRSARK
jgi:hypothetical protein